LSVWSLYSIRRYSDIGNGARNLLRHGGEALDGGQTGATDPTQRKMSQGSEQVTYGLYRDAAHMLPWGSTAGTNTVSGAGNATVQNLAVYGRIPAQTTPSPGLYVDTVVVTVTY
jgi:spore coat protein U-like protein